MQLEKDGNNFKLLARGSCWKGSREAMKFQAWKIGIPPVEFEEAAEALRRSTDTIAEFGAFGRFTVTIRGAA